MEFNRIKNIIKRRGLTVKEVLKIANIREATFYNCQKRNSIETKYLEEIAKVLDVPMSYFFEDSQNGITANANGSNQIINNGNGNKQTINFKNEKIEELKQKIDNLERLLQAKDEIIELLKNK